MKRRALALLLFFSGAALAASGPSAPIPLKLPPGRYAVALNGMLCAVCARAIAAEWTRLPEVEKASVDFAGGSALVTVRLGRTLKVAALRKALRRAERVANLGARYDLDEVRYVP